MNQMSEAARLMGKAKSIRKTMAARLNGTRTCRPGKKRGWPKGKKRK